MIQAERAALNAVKKKEEEAAAVEKQRRAAEKESRSACPSPWPFSNPFPHRECAVFSTLFGIWAGSNHPVTMNLFFVLLLGVALH